MHVQAPAGTLALGIRAVLGLGLIGLLAGCTTPPLESARANFYLGRFAQADQNLAKLFVAIALQLECGFQLCSVYQTCGAEKLAQGQGCFGC